jgi:hypothetical protein
MVGKIEQLTQDSGIRFIRKMAMKKQKGYHESNISVSEWMEAETRTRDANASPRPANSITVEEYAQMRVPPVSRTHAQCILRSLYLAGEAKREKWLPGNGPPRMVYWLVKVKKKSEFK